MYPALAVLQAAKAKIDSLQGVGEQATGVSESPGQSVSREAVAWQPSRLQLTTLWVGGIKGMEADLVKREGVRFEAIPAAGVHGVDAKALPGNLWRLMRGFFASLRILHKFQPDALLFTGGYVAVPMALAGRLSRKVKSLLYVPDIEPGLALKTLARFADRIALTVDESKAYFPGKTNLTVTGYPLRPGLNAWSKEAARKVFALRQDMPLLLVAGGSKGARSINMALLAVLPELLAEMQVLHLCGQLDWGMVEQARNALPPQLSARYRVYPYLHKEMGAALCAADLAVMRAGASTLGELPLLGLPAILVPYPFAWRYQKVNAQYLAERGAAEVVEDADLPEKLRPLVHQLMANVERRQQMSLAMGALAQPQAAEQIADLLIGSFFKLDSPLAAQPDEDTDTVQSADLEQESDPVAPTDLVASTVQVRI